MRSGIVDRIWAVVWERETCGKMTCGINNLTEVCVQPWCDPLWLTGLKAPTLSLSLIYSLETCLASSKHQLTNLASSPLLIDSDAWTTWILGPGSTCSVIFRSQFKYIQVGYLCTVYRGQVIYRTAQFLGAGCEGKISGCSILTSMSNS